MHIRGHHQSAGRRLSKRPNWARRFWPIVCHGRIDRNGLERDREQLWAEAVYHYQQGANWWLETPELEALATAEQKARFKLDPWQPRVERWIGRRKRVRLSDVLSGALRIAVRDQSRSAQMRVADIPHEPSLREASTRR